MFINYEPSLVVETGQISGWQLQFYGSTRDAEIPAKSKIEAGGVRMES